jgi:hypothetical protein
MDVYFVIREGEIFG